MNVSCGQSGWLSYFMGLFGSSTGMNVTLKECLLQVFMCVCVYVCVGLFGSCTGMNVALEDCLLQVFMCVCVCVSYTYMHNDMHISLRGGILHVCFCAYTRVRACVCVYIYIYIYIYCICCRTCMVVYM